MFPSKGVTSFSSRPVGQMFQVNTAAVSCSANAYRLGGVGLGSGMMGKLGRAWVGAWVGAWHGAWVMVVVVM